MSNLPVTAIMWPEMSFWQCKDYFSYLGFLVTRWLFSLYFKKVQLKTFLSSAQLKQVARVWSGHCVFSQAELPSEELVDRGWQKQPQNLDTPQSKHVSRPFLLIYSLFANSEQQFCFEMYFTVLRILEHILH